MAKTSSRVLVITGATGFLGSHFLIDCLKHGTFDRYVCVVRADTDEDGSTRLHETLENAAACSGEAAALRALMPTGLVTTLAGDIHSVRAHQIEPRLGPSASRHVEILHCAANLSFQDEACDAVWATNVGAARNLWRIGEEIGATCFNHVSTAYVAGQRTGTVLENRIGYSEPWDYAGEEERPGAPYPFNNAYEESKWYAEGCLLRASARSPVRIRILRPSIVVGHSQTLRTSSKNGFYQVATMLHILKTSLGPERGLLNVRIPADPRVPIDVVPVDQVVSEMRHILTAGATTYDKIFHLTSDDPITVADMFARVLTVTGVRLVPSPEGQAEQASEKFLRRRLKHYLPYYLHPKQFSRANTRSCLPRETQGHLLLRQARLRAMAAKYLGDQLSAGMAPGSRTLGETC